MRAAITKSCIGDAADVICCLPPGATVGDILEKFKCLYGSVESLDTLMQELYCIAQGKSERVQTFVLHLEWALKAIKKQYPYALTEEEGHKHLKDCLFHGLKPNLHNALLITNVINQTLNIASWSRLPKKQRLRHSEAVCLRVS